MLFNLLHFKTIYNQFLYYLDENMYTLWCNL